MVEEMGAKMRAILGRGVIRLVRKEGPRNEGVPPLTFLTLQGHTGLQVVHLHLEPLESEVIFSRLALVGDEHNDDDDEQ